MGITNNPFIFCVIVFVLSISEKNSYLKFSRLFDVKEKNILNMCVEMKYPYLEINTCGVNKIRLSRESMRCCAFVFNLRIKRIQCIILLILENSRSD